MCPKDILDNLFDRIIVFENGGTIFTRRLPLPALKKAVQTMIVAQPNGQANIRNPLLHKQQLPNPFTAQLIDELSGAFSLIRKDLPRKLTLAQIQVSGKLGNQIF